MRETLHVEVTNTSLAAELAFGLLSEMSKQLSTMSAHNSWVARGLEDRGRDRPHLAGGPPHRSQRAGLPHWAPALGDGRRIAWTGRDAARGALAATVLGFSLDEVESLLELAAGGPDSCDAAQRLAQQRMAELDRRIADLRAMRDALDRLVATCAMPRAERECPLLHPSMTQPEERDRRRRP
jgi:hypothetical protein